MKKNLDECGFLTVNLTLAIRTLTVGLKVLKSGRPEGLLKLVKKEDITEEQVNTGADKDILQTSQHNFVSRKDMAECFYYKSLPEDLKTVDVERK